MELRGAGSIGLIVVALAVVGTRSHRLWTRCEVARELTLKHVPEEQIGDWLCIAEHGSAYNGSAANLRFKWFGGTGYYGLFQIIDRYACARYGSICGLGSCDQLLDDELDDDIECMLKVHAAYTRELGDGFAAWPIHKSACRGGQVPPVGSFAHCLDEEVVRVQAYFKRKRAKAKTAVSNRLVALAAPGKVYERCELARELRDRHQLPEDQIATWVCIAYHESRFNTSAEGRLNADGSGDHGLFQISDIYWCSTDAHRPGKACGVTCEAMRDSDIADDVRCVRTIHDEHRRLSGNGFNAWTVFKPYCAGREASFVHNCFDEERVPTTANRPRPGIVAPTTPIVPVAAKADPTVATVGKVYDRCELANDLLHKFHFPREQVATWVCIAYHESRFNTSAEGRLNADGSGDHGLFQISDIYWCSPPGKGWACGVSCAALKDADITDDVRCVRTIFDEHQRLSGDGFNAWSVYKPYCQAGRSEEFTNGCFGDSGAPSVTVSLPRPAITAPTPLPSPGRVGPTSATGKVFERCELAQLLHLRHGLSLDETATWVCIAKHQSSFNSSAIGHGPDGVQYHGMFQLSDEFWCSPPGRGFVCGIACDRLRDSELTDDLACMRHILEEHQRISGDGFNAWAVYQPHCKGKSATLLDGCFEEGENALVPTPPTTRRPVPPPKNLPRGKVYQRCELAQELYYRHGLPFDQIATWVCIAHRESNYNVSAIGRLNADGSEDHGLFQISDIYWCSPPGKGWVCGLTCSDLEDNDLTDDVECMRTIHEEHTRLSGDGFNAWAVYRPYCQGRSEPYIDGCFAEESTTTTVRRPTYYAPSTTVKPSTTKARPRTSTTPYRPWSRATTKRPTVVTSSRFTTITTTTTATTSIQRRPTINAPSRLQSTSTLASAPKSTTSLYDFYLNHFGRRPAITTAMPVYTFKPFASRQRATASTAPRTTLPPPATATASTITPGEDPPPETTTRRKEFNRWFQSG
uniref:lysozyme n=1 Tax=Anopheles atroparvus TaxID=41427 RepID=A0A182IRU2_ANOAO